MEVILKPSRKVKIGQMAQLTVDLKWKKDEGEYFFAKPEFSLEGMKIEEVGESNEIFQRGEETWKRKTFRFLLKPLQSGRGRIPPFRIKFSNPAAPDSRGAYLEVPPFELKIIPDRSRLFRNAFIAGGLLTLGGVLGWLILKRSRKTLKDSEEDRPSLEERYASFLNNASSSQNVYEGGEIFCSYLVEKYNLGTEPITAQEIIARLQGKMSSEEWRTLKGILESLDELRYAGRKHSAGEGRDIYREMIHFVEGKRVVA